MRANTDANVNDVKALEKRGQNERSSQIDPKDMDTAMPLVGASADSTDAHRSLAIDIPHVNPLDMSNPGNRSVIKSKTAATSLDDNISWPDNLNLDGDGVLGISNNEINRLFQTPLSEFSYSPLFDFLDDSAVTMTSDSSSPTDNLMSGTVSRASKKPSTDFNFSYPNSAMLLAMDYSHTAEKLGSAHRTPFFNSVTSAISQGDAMSIDAMDGICLQTSDSILNETRSQLIASRAPSLTTHSVGSNHASLLTSSLNNRCKCYASILQYLSSLDSATSITPTPSLDIVLRLEQNAQRQAASVLRCETCTSSRPNLLLLLAVAIDSIVSMLEAASTARSKSQRNLANFGRLSASSRMSSSSSLYRLGGNTTANVTSTGATSSSPNLQNPNTPASSNPSEIKNEFATPATTSASLAVLPVDALPLTVGSLEILAEEKTNFLKQLLQRRLTGLSNSLKQLRAFMMQGSVSASIGGGINGSSGSAGYGSTRTGLMVVGETVRRLRCVVGRVELWDC
jgi:hypothetical protein